MEGVLHLSCGFCSSASTSSPTDTPVSTTSPGAGEVPSAPTTSPTTRPSRTAQLLTFDAPLGARGLAPAVAALPPADIDPAGTANKDQCPAGHPRSPCRAGPRGGRWPGETKGGKNESSRLNSTARAGRGARRGLPG